MITSEQLYWLTRLDYIRWFFGLLVVGSIFSTVGFTISFFEDKRRAFPCLKHWALGSAVVLLVSSGSCVLIPTTQEMAAIKIIPQIANSAKVQELPGNIVDLANSWLKELKPKGDSK